MKCKLLDELVTSEITSNGTL